MKMPYLNPRKGPPFQGVELEPHSSPDSGEVAEGRRGKNEPPRPTDTPPFQGGELEPHSSPDSGEVAEGRRGKRALKESTNWCTSSMA
jgi:hypothetical protein